MAKKSGDSVRVLLAASSRSDARLFRESLQEYRLRTFDVKPAACLTEAVALAAKGCFDAAVLDLKLPDSHGLEACEKMRQAAPDVPIIVLAGTDEEPVAVKAMRQGVQDYLIKGQTQGGALGRAVHHAVEHRRAQRTLQDAQERLQAQTEELRAQAEELTAANEQLRERERALQESEHRYRTVADFTHDWEFWLRPDGYFEYISPSAQRIVGRPVEPDVSAVMLLKQIVHPDDLAQRLEHLDHELAGADSHEMEFRIVRPDGEIRWIHHVCRPIHDAQGHFLGTRGSNRDITRRKLAEQALNEANERLQEQAEELEVQTEELRAQQEELQSQAEELRESEQALRRMNEELEHRVAARTEDLSKANDALRQVGAHTRGLIEASLDPLVTIGPDGKITDVNAATETVTGYTRKQLIGTDFSRYFTEPVKAQAGYRRVFQEGFVRDYPLEIRHKSSRVTEVLYNATVYRDEAGNTVGVFAAARDVTELHRAEQMQARLAAIVESSDDAIIGKDLTGKITSWNKGAEKIYGYTAEEVVGRPISLLTPGESSEETDRILAQLRQGKVVEHYETVRVTKDGRSIHVSLTVSPIRAVTGQVIGASTIARDITERKRAEEAIRRAGAYNRSLIEASLDPLVTIGPDGKITDVNAATEAVTGYARKKLTGADFCDYFTDPAQARAGYQQVFKEGFVRDYPLELRHKTGRVTEVLYNATVYRDGAGNTVGVFAAARDVTELRRAEASVRMERQRLKDVLEMLPAYVVLLTPDHHVPFANRFFRERFGESGGKRCFEYLFGRTEPCEPCDSYKVLETHAPHHWEWTGPDGRNYDIHDFPFTDTDGSSLIMEMGIDITERKQAEAELAKHRDHLEQLVRERTSQLEMANTQLRTEVAERRKAELALQKAHENLQAQSEELVAANEELAAQSEELQTANEELREQEQRLQVSLRQTRRTAERLDLLSGTASRLLASEEPQAVVEELCVRVMEFLDCQAFFNFLVDEQAGRLRLNACAGIPKEERRKIEWLDFGVAVCGCSARDEQRIVAEHIPDSDDERTALVKSYGIKAYACHPIMTGEKVLGTLSFGTNTRETFCEDELGLMKAVTDMVAIAVQRQQSQQALRQSREDLDRAQAVGQVGSWRLDTQRDVLTWSDENHRIFGVPEGTALTYEAFLGIVHPDDRQYVDTQWQAGLRGEPYDVEHRIVADGKVKWVREKAYLEFDGAGGLLGGFGITQDVTARKEMETQLRQLNEQLEEKVSQRTEQLTATIDRLQDEVVRRVLAEGKLRKNSQMLEGFFQHTITPLAFLDRRFNFVRVNEAYARSDGKDPQYFVGKNHFQLYPHDENRAVFEKVVQTRQPYRAYAKPFAYPDDSKRITFWNWQLTPLLSEAGEVQSLVLNLQDVTEQQRAYEELEQRTRQLQHLALELSQAEDRERKRLAEILHDDLQQILAASKFHLGILSSRLRNDEPLQEIVAQLDQMLREALEKSRSLSHELSPAVLYQGDLGETFEWLAQQLQTKHGLTVQVEARGRVDSGSDALKAFLYRSAQEMLFNVVKHAKVREARLRLKRTHGQLWLSIHDRGQGFDPKALSKAAGFGLLSIRERVELLGGRMKIRSVPNRGSTVLIAVPDPQEAQAVTEADLHGAREKRKRMEAKSPGRLRVLLVDDHKVMREGLATLLNEQHDMEVVGQAGNGREAVDLAHELVPDVIIMDAAMPVMAGDEATRQIKVHLPRIRIIGLSMFDEPQMAKKMRRAGAEAYLLKTAPSDELLAAIRGARAAK